MAAMRAVGNGHKLPPHARVREGLSEYLIELDVSDFTECELSLEAIGPRLTVRGDQLETTEDDGQPFRIHERLEETFRLPDDADAAAIHAVYKHGTLVIHAPRTALEMRQVPIETAPYRLVNPNAEAC